MISSFIADNTPVIGYLEATLRCNHACAHCYVERSIPAVEHEMSREEIGRVLDQLADLGTLILVVTGGEPFERPDILEILKDARVRDFALVVFTNGSRIGSREAVALYDLAPLGVEISLHGHDAATHDAVTGVVGSFDRAVNAMKLLTQNGTRVKLKCNLFQFNDGKYEQMIELAENLGVEFRFDPYIFPRRDGDNSPVTMRLDGDVIGTILTDPRLVPSADCEVDRAYLQIPTNRLCGAGRNVIRVSSDGGVYPCVPLGLCAGNIREKSLAAIWKTSDVFTQLRSLHCSDLAECAECDLAKSCARCSAMAFAETGNLLGCSPLSKRFAQARMTALKQTQELGKVTGA